MSNRPNFSRHRPRANRRNRTFASIESTIRRTSFAIVTVGGACSVPGCACDGSASTWSYTVGRARRGLPELITAGIVDYEAAGELTNLVAHSIDHHELMSRLEPDGSVEVGLGTVRFDRVPASWLTTDPTRMAVWFEHFRRPMRDPKLHPSLLQVVLSDLEGYFPEDLECDVEIAQQRLLAVDPIGYPASSYGRAG